MACRSEPVPGSVIAIAPIMSPVLASTLWGTPWHPHQAGPLLWDKISEEGPVTPGKWSSVTLSSERLTQGGYWLRARLERPEKRIRHDGAEGGAEIQHKVALPPELHVMLIAKTGDSTTIDISGS